MSLLSRLAPTARPLPFVTALALFLPALLPAQSLRGSRASIARMYREALAEDLSFFETPASVRRQVAAGRLVRLEPNGSFTLHAVNYPFVRPATRTFVQRLAAQYQDACGERLVVTSAVRPATRQPANSTERSVHPTGMAVDLRKPTRGSCLRWLRGVLLELEGTGVLEATEERSPAHFHVAVFPTRYARYVTGRTRPAREARLAGAAPAAASANGSSKSAAAPASAAASTAATTATAATAATTAGATYTVRPGDTLWGIAAEHETTVEAISRANDLDDETLQPGQELRIPGGD